MVRTRLDGTIHLLYRGNALRYHALSRAELTRCVGPRPNVVKDPQKNTKKPARVPTGTPWRQGVTAMFAETRK